MTKTVLNLALAGCLAVTTGFAATKTAKVTLNDAAGKAVGTALITDKSGSGVTVKLEVKGLPPGEHALHFHQTAKCEGPAFTTAGGHFNPAGKKHGMQNPDGPHAGDMNNFTVKPNGTAKVTISDANVNLGDGPNSLYSNGGTALMIHAAADDMKSDPAGNAGARIACGTITK